MTRTLPLLALAGCVGQPSVDMDRGEAICSCAPPTPDETVVQERWSVEAPGPQAFFAYEPVESIRTVFVEIPGDAGPVTLVLDDDEWAYWPSENAVFVDADLAVGDDVVAQLQVREP